MSNRLHVDASGRLRDKSGQTAITYNIPFPTDNGSWGSGAMMGVVMHTEVGYEHSVIDEFNNIVSQASATFSIGDDGHIHQYGPIGKGWFAWAQEAGNPEWYSIEHEDHGDPTNLLTDAQILASAPVVECLATFAGFPLQISNHTNRKGYGIHQMGGVDWGNHSCPQATWSVPLTQGRAAQRSDIIAKAKLLRAPATKVVLADGKTSLADYAKAHSNRPVMVAIRTLARFTSQTGFVTYLLTGKWSRPIAKGTALVLIEYA